MVNNKIIGISCEDLMKNTYHSGKYIPCWKIHTMLENTYHAGQCIPCYVNEMKD
jgi:hypothetical protein